MNLNISGYHRDLFRWHCLNFFDFESALSRAERKYLRKCWALAQDYREVSDGGYRHFSYYTYSHRVKGSTVNSSRIAYGSVLHPARAFRAVGPVLAERGIELPESLTQKTKFYGLGWDIQKEQFKSIFAPWTGANCIRTFWPWVRGTPPPNTARRRCCP